MTRSLVTGAAGFLGSHLVDRLLGEGHEVVGVDNLATGQSANLSRAAANDRFRFVRHDITQPLGDVGDLDLLWHLASPASPPDYLRMPVETLRVGSEGTRTALECARRTGARFLLASTSEVYGDPEVSPQPESYWGRVNPVGPRSVYDEAKRFAEALTMAYHRSHDLDTRIVRIFNTYGPRMRLDDGRVVPNFIGQALRGEPLTVYGDGSQTRSFCYYTDLLEGIARAMARPIGPDPVNLGTDVEMTILDLARIVCDIAQRPLRTQQAPLPVDDPRQRRPDLARARAVLEWEPTVPLREGLEATWNAFQTHAPSAP